MPSTESLSNEFQELARSGRYAEILERLRILTGIDQLHKVYWSLFAYNNIGHVKDGIEYFKMNQMVIKKYENNQLTPKIWNTIGDLYYKNGKTLVAYEYYQKAFESGISLNQLDDVSIALNNLGTVNVTRGNFDKGLEFYEKCYQNAMNAENLVQQSNTLYNIGNTHFLRKELETARKYFLESLELRREIGNQTRIALTLKSLIEIEFDTQKPDMDTVNRYNDELRRISNEKNTEQVMLYYLSTKALICKWEGDFNKSELIYRDIIEENQEIDITVSSILNMIEILFIRYKSSPNDKILEDIHYFLDIMLEISRNQFSFRYLVRSLILKSQVMSIEGNFDEAYILIEKALQSTKDHKMDYLREEILNLKETLGSEYDKLKKLFEEDTSVLSRLNSSSIMEFLKEPGKI